MSDDLDIRGGGAVAVDTVTLRVAAAAFTSLGGELDDIARLVGSTSLRLYDVTRALGASYALEVVRRRIIAVTETGNDIAAALRDAAAVYEIVELRAERAVAEAAGDDAAVARIDGRLGALAREHPDAADRAALGVFGHRLTWPTEMALQAPGVLWWLSPVFPTAAIPLAWSALWALGAAGVGRVPRTASLRGSPRNVTVTPVGAPVAVTQTGVPRAPARAPASLADAAARIPGGGSTRIRVERYAMADGSRQFAVYVAGTQTVVQNTRDPFDMASNVELYSGERSASYDATLAALDQAGARPGDAVHAFGHSQGAMIASHIAIEGGYDTQTLVTFGSPIDADVGEGTLSVAMRHADDPVSALAGGGHVVAVGAPGSFTAERTADPLPGMHDLGIPAHGIDVYTDTARLLDASDDPRVGAVRRVFDELGGAASVEVTEFAAQRTDIRQPNPQPNIQPQPAPTTTPVASDAG